ncbi:YolD-like family protein [Effusibacillus consociatus]|uniref:YolD-like family protein n=1 Tax=Effusibacillus consociatus TaxID=1117041 RepID=A0ABV9Q3K6_9BACL
MRITDGNIFEAMRLVLPEHRERMETMKRELQRQEKPVLSEDKLAEMSVLLSEAIQDDRLTILTVYHPYGNQEVRLYPQRVDQVTNRLIGVDPFGDPESVKLSDILDVTM